MSNSVKYLIKFDKANKDTDSADALADVFAEMKAGF